MTHPPVTCAATALDDLANVPFHLAPDSQRARMLSLLANTELSVAIERPPVNGVIDVQIFDIDGARVALACDGDDRLAQFFGQPVLYVTMPGRAVARVLKDHQAGLLINPGFVSQMLLDADMLEWLVNALEVTPHVEQSYLRFGPALPEVVAALSSALAQRLADLRGMISGAAMVGRHEGLGHVLLIFGTAEADQPLIAKSLAETLAFLPAQPGGVDISFADIAPPKGALVFDMTPVITKEPASILPSKPKGPPILR